MSYRNDLDALEARHDALDAEVARRTAEREQTRARLDDARKRASLPILDNIGVAAPCNASWDAMSGDDRVRHCGDCKKNVYNLSEMTRDDAQALIAAHEGKLCVRFFRRSDGTILTQDCSVGVTKRRRRRLVVAAGAALVAVGAAAVAVMHSASVTGMVRVESPVKHDVTMGQMKLPDRPAPPTPPVPAPPA